MLLDVRNYICPLSILKIRSMLDCMSIGETLEVWSNDLETKEDLQQIIKNSNDELLRIENQEGYDKFFIQRGAKT